MCILGSSTIAIIGTRELPEVTVSAVIALGGPSVQWAFNYNPEGGTTLELCAGLQLYDAVEEVWQSPIAFTLYENSIECEYPDTGFVGPGVQWRVTTPAQGIPFDDPDSDDSLGLTLGQTGTVEE